MPAAILVLNAGSSSIKFSLFDATETAIELRLRGELDAIGTRGAHFVAHDTAGVLLDEYRWPSSDVVDHDTATHYVLSWLGRSGAGKRLLGVGHRVVHGGTVYEGPVRIDDDVINRLERFIPLAPLHQPHNLAPIRAIHAGHPHLAQIACFDTSFHRGQPTVAQSFALPPEITQRGVHRFGFHGLSYEYIASVLPQLDPRAAAGRTVVAHLGNGASMCALAAGRSVATTMGFTTLDGLPMGTRCGALDPGVILYLLDEMKWSARRIEDVLYHRSGLLGVSGVSSDMRTLLASSDPRAAAAIDLFVYRVGRELGSLAAALGGLDALVFTAGIGERAAPIRARVCRQAAWLGVRLDEAANLAHGPRISRSDSAVAVWVVPTDEEKVIAGHVRALLD